MKRILFIGNSYTFYHDMPQTVASLAAEKGIQLDVTAVTQGGYKLAWYANPQNKMRQKLEQTIEGQQYDWVVLQDQSCNPITDEANFLQGVACLRELLAPKTKRFLLYATWGREAGSTQLDKLGMTTPEMTEGLDAAYTRAGERFCMDVAHVGKAFAAYGKEHPEVSLYHSDHSHPSPAGSALAARTILSVMLGE